MHTLIVHGGAGSFSRERPGADDEYRSTLRLSLDAGNGILRGGGAAVDAVKSAVAVLEDSPLFNAGRGSTLSHEGDVEMDAAIMNGENRMIGACAGVRFVKNPVGLAYELMQKNLMLCSSGAENFARKRGLTFEDAGYFLTEYRRKQFERVRHTEGHYLDHGEYGTVGAVALDRHGKLAAATSTGGMTNKPAGRVGDSPLIGAGTYADHGVAISCTGQGEFFIRTDVAALHHYKGLPLEEAAEEVICNKIASLGGAGGLIAVNRNGQLAMPYNTQRMYRGFVREDGLAQIFLK